MIKNLFLSLGYFLIYVVIANVFITLFNYFDILSSSGIGTLKFLVPVVGIAVISYFLGKKSVQKGFLEGLKLGCLVVFIFLGITILLGSFDVRSLIYYLVMILTSVLSSMLGINRKDVNKVK